MAVVNSNDSLDTPILIIIFNRQDCAKQIFESIKSVRPRQLFIAADGPREDGEKILCDATRDIFKRIDWSCELKTLYQDQNIGCRKSVTGAISWFFSFVEHGIILEDDCLPHPDFYFFAEKMLLKYSSHPDIMHIAGGNYQFHRMRGNASYYFSRIAHTWGWATWKRCWEKFDVSMDDFPKFLRTNQKQSFFPDLKSEKYWLYFFNRVYREQKGWDYQWVYHVMKNFGICITPNVNLISNIGFQSTATSTHFIHPFLSNMMTYPVGHLTHPAKIEFNLEADSYVITYPFGHASLAKVPKILHIWWDIFIHKFSRRR